MSELATLEDAWAWYENTRRQLRLVERLARRYWEDLDWQGAIGRDDEFKSQDPHVLAARSNDCQGHLEDLAIVVLFSVFEATVRTKVLHDVAKDEAEIRHPSLKLAIERAKKLIREGSFFDVLEPFKDGQAGLVEQVHQIRRYRNWVAHGKRGDRPNAADPRMAFERLRLFLVAIDAADDSV